jgi:hypothetical protein
VWYHNNGSAGFAVQEVEVKNGPHSIIASELDGDGDLDIIAATQKAGEISWYENDGSLN